MHVGRVMQVTKQEVLRTCLLLSHAQMCNHSISHPLSFMLQAGSHQTQVRVLQ